MQRAFPMAQQILVRACPRGNDVPRAAQTRLRFENGKGDIL